MAGFSVHDSITLFHILIAADGETDHLGDVRPQAHVILCRSLRRPGGRSVSSLGIASHAGQTASCGNFCETMLLISAQALCRKDSTSSTASMASMRFSLLPIMNFPCAHVPHIAKSQGRFNACRQVQHRAPLEQRGAGRGQKGRCVFSFCLSFFFPKERLRLLLLQLRAHSIL